MSDAKRTLLFLHGPSSPFWRELGFACEAAGHRVLKVNLSFGETVYWRRRGAIYYRGRLSRWRDFLEKLVIREGITDILYYADRFAYHVIAAEVARAHGIQAVALENGYLRPDWLTLERAGMGAFSHFPDEPAKIRAIAAATPEPDLTVRYQHGFWTEMVHEATYHLFAHFWRIFHPFFRSGLVHDPLLEILIGIPPLFQKKKDEARAEALVEELVAGAMPFHVAALQLQGDYQIRDNSPFTNFDEMLRQVIASYARHAEPEGRLVFKQHPHDNGRHDWARRIARIAAEFGIGDRIVFLKGGDLGKLLGKARGCVMINSTVGLFSLRLGCPTKILGIAIYDMPGLTHQGPLDSFWTSPEAVDASLCDAFVRAIAASIQIKGSFYDPEGRKAAIDQIVSRVIGRKVNEPGGFVDPPPRLEKAQKLGVFSKPRAPRRPAS